MNFETQRVPVERQIALIDRIIHEYSGMLGVFDGPYDRDIRGDVTNDIVVLIAAKHSLMRLGDCETTVDVPTRIRSDAGLVYERAMRRKGNAIL